MQFDSLRRAGLGLVAAGLVVLAMPALAQPEATVLSVRGLVAAPKGGEGLDLNMPALQRMPQHSFSTNSPWTQEPHTYSGPLLRDVLDLVKAHGTQLKAMALNDYTVTIPVEDARRFDVILAIQIDGKPIPVRERGPLFIMYPFDQEPQLRAPRYYARAIWQLKSLRVE
jgi:hypothetical protein